MKITLEQAVRLLQDCAAIIFDDSVLVYPSLADLTGENDNEFMYLSWTTNDGDFYLKFQEENNREVEIVGSSMWLKDTDGEDPETTQITLLFPRELEKMLV